MKDLPIIFTGTDPAKIRAGTKTQTRRIIKRQPYPGNANAGWADIVQKPGDRLWVREAFCEEYNDNGKPTGGYLYRADGHDVVVDDGDGFAEVNKDGSLKSPWKSAAIMPRRANRTLLEVVSVRAERLQDISEADAVAEGVDCWVCGGKVDGTSEEDCGCFHSRSMARESYRAEWERIHGPGSWALNPVVEAVTFKVVQS